MTSIFDKMERIFHVLLLRLDHAFVTQVRTNEVDGYEALQLGFDDKTEKHTVKAETGHFAKAGTGC